MMTPEESPSTFMSCSDEPGLLRRTEPRAILRRIDERPHHLRIDKVAVEVQLGKPERKAAVIRIAQQVTPRSRRLGCAIRAAATHPCSGYRRSSEAPAGSAHRSAGCNSTAPCVR